MLQVVPYLGYLSCHQILVEVEIPLGPPPPPQGGSGAKVRRHPGDPTTRKKGESVYEAEKEFQPEELGNDVSVCPRCHLDQVTH